MVLGGANPPTRIQSPAARKEPFPGKYPPYHYPPGYQPPATKFSRIPTHLTSVSFEGT